MFELIYENKLVLVILVLLSMVGCIIYSMKDKLFKSKQVSFDTDVTIVDDQDYIPSSSFTGRKPGYVFKNGIQGIGYYKDKIEMEKLK
tara:strand:+ start:172 stop:435 length:264 start_codon:yes stop_codon:yes gene_type:complete